MQKFCSHNIDYNIQIDLLVYSMKLWIKKYISNFIFVSRCFVTI